MASVIWLNLIDIGKAQNLPENSYMMPLEKCLRANISGNPRDDRRPLDILPLTFNHPVKVIIVKGNRIDGVTAIT